MNFSRQQVIFLLLLTIASILLVFFFGYALGRYERIEVERFNFREAPEINSYR